MFCVRFLQKSAPIPLVCEYSKLCFPPLKWNAAGCLRPVSSYSLNPVQQWLKALKYGSAACKGGGSAARHCIDCAHCSAVYAAHVAVWRCWRMPLRTKIRLIFGTAVIAVKHLTSVVSGYPAAVMSGQFCWVDKAEERRHQQEGRLCNLRCICPSVHGSNFQVWWQKWVS